MSLINTEIKQFKAEAYHNGEFVTVTQETIKGKWAVFFFYPADFTFVCPTEPDDIRYFCEALITGPGERINTPSVIKFELDLSIDYVSAVPHNALHDARGIRNYFAGEKE